MDDYEHKGPAIIPSKVCIKEGIMDGEERKWTSAYEVHTLVINEGAEKNSENERMGFAYQARTYFAEKIKAGERDHFIIKSSPGWINNLRGDLRDEGIVCGCCFPRGQDQTEANRKLERLAQEEAKRMAKEHKFTFYKNYDESVISFS